MKHKAIIFGASGQDGYYLTELLQKSEIEVVGIARSAADVIGDIGNFTFVENAVKLHKPDYIFHFAANSTTGHEALFENHQSIATGTLNILESIFKHSKETRIFISGSALQFVNTGAPIRETDAFEARDAYSISRIQSVYAARYFRTLGLRVYVGYFFHHDSPLRSERHLNMRIAKTAKMIKDGIADVLEVGDVNVVKEFNYAGDLMRAVWLLVNQEAVFEAVIGCGVGHSIREWIEVCFAKVGLVGMDYIKLNSAFKPEFSTLISNPETLKSLGWEPELDMETLALKMMERV